MLLVICMVLTAAPVNTMAEEKPIVYVSIDDSMTNGYCLNGYDGNSGGVNYGIETYANKLASWLAGYNGTIADDQVIFSGTKGTVDHRPRAISGMRAQDIQWVLNLDYEDESLMKDLYANEYQAAKWSESKWYDTWKFPGDRRTWADFCDSTYRYGRCV